MNDYKSFEEMQTEMISLARGDFSNPMPFPTNNSQVDCCPIKLQQYSKQLEAALGSYFNEIKDHCG